MLNVLSLYGYFRYLKCSPKPAMRNIAVKTRGLRGQVIRVSNLHRRVPMNVVCGSTLIHQPRKLID